MTKIYTKSSDKRRNSSIELLCIIAMFIIITHHFCVHGIFNVLGNTYSMTVNNLSFQFVFSQLLMWIGYIGNAIFILITGYYMINKKSEL